MIVAGTSATVYPAAQFPITIQRARRRPGRGESVRVRADGALQLRLRGTAGEMLPRLVERVREL